ncbi:MAG TPA: hypothetical protein PLY93_06380 [Turneriella sp.]|nr:hypothetical protein [Turneriella sp.]
MRLFRYTSFFFILTSCLLAAALSTSERKAVLREMIEMDVAARNLTSIIATSDKKMLDDTLQRLVSWQIQSHPEHGKPFAKALAKWKDAGALRYGNDLQKEARALRAYANARGKFSVKDWEHTKDSFTKILTACQGCHSITKKE